MKEKGFTLIEMLLVVAFLGLMGLVISPGITSMLKKMNDEKYNGFLRDIFLSTEAYLQKNILNYEDILLVDGQAYIYVEDLIESGYLKSTTYDTKNKMMVIDELDFTVVVTLTEDKTYSYKLYEERKEPVYKEDILMGTDPELFKGLIPVTISSTGEVTVADQKTEWYNYTAHNWANAVLVNNSDNLVKAKYFNDDMTLKNTSVGTVILETEILQYYVWIPRYKYKLWNVNNSSSTEQAIDIVFENKDTDKSISIANGNYYTHPAFTFGTTELNGFWVGKFKASGTTTSLKIKPNTLNLSNQNFSTVFNSVRNMELTYSSSFGILPDEIDTHLTKNMERGAIAYLTNSVYGRYTNSTTCIASGCEVWINNTNSLASGTLGPAISGCSGATVSAAVQNSLSSCTNGYSWSGLGVNASTTGNITGIYDMAGGNWELAMGNMVYSNGNFYVSSSGFASIPDSKYFDSYAYSASSTTNHERGKIGDSTKETLKVFGSNTGGWNLDNAYLPNEPYSWFLRGGDSSNGTGAGIFAFSRSSGGVSNNNSFRVVITNQ